MKKRETIEYKYVCKKGCAGCEQMNMSCTTVVTQFKDEQRDPPTLCTFVSDRHAGWKLVKA